MKLIQILATSFFFTFLIIGGCSKGKPPERAKVTFSFKGTKVTAPQKIKGSHALTAAPSPSSLADFNCIGILATYPELPALNDCSDIDGNHIGRPDNMAGLASFNMAGQSTVSMDGVLIGDNRLFHVVGFKTADGTCPSIFSDFDVVGDNVSDPYILGQKTANISATNNSVNIAITNNFATFTRVGDCSGPLFDWGGGTGYVDCGTITSSTDVVPVYMECMGPQLGWDYYMVYDLVNSNSWSGGEVVVMKTSNGDLAKIEAVSGTPGEAWFNYLVYDSTTHALLYTGSSSIGLTHPNIDLDQTGAIPTTSNVSGVSDLGFVQTSTWSLLYIAAGTRWRQVYGSIPNGPATHLAFYEPDGTGPLDTQYSLVYGTCSSAVITSLDQNGAPAAVSTPVTVTLDAYTNSGVSVGFYSDVGCTTPISAAVISGGSTSSTPFYFTATSTSGNTDSVLIGSDQAGSPINETGLYQQWNP